MWRLNRRSFYTRPLAEPRPVRANAGNAFIVYAIVHARYVPGYAMKRPIVLYEPIARHTIDLPAELSEDGRRRTLLNAVFVRRHVVHGHEISTPRHFAAR